MSCCYSVHCVADCELAAHLMTCLCVLQIKDGTLHVQIGRVFKLDEIVEAHRCMEENKAGGKIVVLT